MDRKTLVLLLIALGLIVSIIVMFLNPKKSLLSAPQTIKQETITQISPSKTLKSYSDPAGFTFSYPDNLSLVNNDPKDNTTYADIQLTAKGVEGNLAIKIVDSKVNSLEEWVKTTKFTQSPKEVKLGSLKALEIAGEDRLLLGSIDQGILFTVETPNKDNKDFWTSAHDKVLADFSFAPPATSQGSGSSDGVIFEGEEVSE